MPKFSIQNPQNNNVSEAANLSLMLDILNDEQGFIHQIASLVRAIQIADDANGIDGVFLCMAANTLLDSQLERLGDHETYYFLRAIREAKNRGVAHE